MKKADLHAWMLWFDRAHPVVLLLYFIVMLLLWPLTWALGKFIAVDSPLIDDPPRARKRN